MDHQAADTDTHQSDHATVSDHEEQQGELESQPGTEEEGDSSDGGSSRDGDGDEGAAASGSSLQKPDVIIREEDQNGPTSPARNGKEDVSQKEAGTGGSTPWRRGHVWV